VNIHMSRHASTGSSPDDQSFAVQFGSSAAPVRCSPIALARRFYQICLTMQAAGLVGEDLTPLQYGVIAFLNEKDGEPGVDQIGLAARMGVERSHVSLLVEGLVAKGLVQQRVNETDRRARALHLTPKGEKLHRRLQPGIVDANDRALEPLSAPERQAFIEMLIKIIGANGDQARPGAGRRKRRSRQSASAPSGKSPSLQI
jgi:DNA-binding MarR family transcriptional regulator